jgi:hypothetical protein
MHALSRSVLLTLGPLGMTLLAGCGTWNVVERKVTVEFAPAGQAPLAVKTANGAIAVGAGAGEKIVVNATIRARSQERADATQIVAAVSPDGKYLIEATWPTPRMSNEGCAFVIATPEVVGLDLSTSNGAVTVTGLSGSARLDSSNGAIVVNGFSGQIDAETSNGSITITGAPAAVTADSSNGRISVELVGSGGPVKLDTSNGTIDLVVGPGFAGTVVGSTSNGSVMISAPGATSVTSGRRSGQATFGTGGAASVLDTSNGNITIRSK